MKATLEKHPQQVASMFDAIASRYDLTNFVLTAGQVEIWRAALKEAVAPRPGLKVLDIAAGTGSSAAVLASSGAEVAACDFSAGMVEEGARRHPELDFTVADAMNLPYADNSFDVATISFGLRNIQDPLVALREMYRVVRPGGQVVVCEFSTPPQKTLRAAYHTFLKSILPVIAKVSAGEREAYEYLGESILNWPDQLELARLMQKAGWMQIEYRNISVGIVALHRGAKKRD